MTSADGGTTWTGTFTPTSSVLDTTNVLTLATSYTDTAGNPSVSNSSNTTANYEIDTKFAGNIDIPLIFDMSGNATVFG